VGGWVDLGVSKKREAEKIKRLIKKTTALQNEENYFDAYSALFLISPSIQDI
jgi:hypothetical protein